MDTTIRLLVEINESQWTCFQHDLGELTEEEINWRPLPQANNINAILRHLLVESRWHLKALKTGEPMPAETNDGPALEINTAPLDFGKNRKELEDNYSSFIAILRETTPQGLKQRTHQAFKHFPTQSPRPDHQLGFHQAIHLASHLGQIRTIRNLYPKTKGKPQRFFADNPTFSV